MHSFFGLLVGLGIFLYGMNQLELAAKNLSGPRLKHWLLHTTNTPISSISSGIFLTALLQSSSLVGLIVLAFASAGVIPLINAIGVFLGANLGTTLTGWVVTLLGFKLDIAEYALPLIAFGGISQIIFDNQSKIRSIAAVALGLGLLLFGLSLMKDSVANLPDVFSIENIQGFSPIIYLLIGVLMTALIQSSSAMMMIALASLNAGLIDLPSAAALVIGADLGTTSTIVLGSITGNVVKRQLAFAHCFFNLTVDSFAFFITLPFLAELLMFFNISDPLFGLVAFHSFFNLVGLLLFLPLLKPFSAWIESLFKKENDNYFSLSKLPTSVPSAAIPMAIESIRQLWFDSTKLNLSYFDLSPANNKSPNDTIKKNATNHKKNRTVPTEAYENIKIREGEIIQYILNIQKQSLTQEEASSVISAIECVRSIVYGCKTLKDIYHNIDALKENKSPSAQQQYHDQQGYIEDFYKDIVRTTQAGFSEIDTNKLLTQLHHNNNQHQKTVEKIIYQLAEDSTRGSSQISTQLNVSHEVHHAIKSFIQGLSFWILIEQ
ncbi:MAG: Na/Pi cotransporter family protein [Cellvibrionaceae bacterium]